MQPLNAYLLRAKAFYKGFAKRDVLIFTTVMLVLITVTATFGTKSIVYAREKALSSDTKQTTGSNSRIKPITTESMESAIHSMPMPAPIGGNGVDTTVKLTESTIIPLKIDGVMPTKNAPKCANHKDTEYHGVWNEEEGCYYDHTHGADPSKTIFADIVSKWPQTISYPWQTTNENIMKHQGYFYIYDEAKNGGCEMLDLHAGSNCITHILYMVHTMGTTAEVNARLHSFRVVARVCDPTKTSCGFVQTGGWSDYGTLHCPYKKGRCPLPVDPQPLPKDNGVLPDLVAIQQPPYRTSVPISDMDRVFKSGQNVQFWNNQQINNIVSAYYPEKYNVLFGSSWSFLDAWGGIDPINPSKLQFICEDGSCQYNHTRTQLFTAVLRNLPAGPFNGYTDKKGNIVSACSTAAADCVPLVIDAGVPGGDAWLSRQVKQGDAEKAPIYEYDVCFDNAEKLATCAKSTDNSAGWIKPNKMVM